LYGTPGFEKDYFVNEFGEASRRLNHAIEQIKNATFADPNDEQMANDTINELQTYVKKCLRRVNFIQNGNKPYAVSNALTDTPYTTTSSQKLQYHNRVLVRHGKEVDPLGFDENNRPNEYSFTYYTESKKPSIE
jgi:hypothetical protein